MPEDNDTQSCRKQWNTPEMATCADIYQHVFYLFISLKCLKQKSNIVLQILLRAVCESMYAHMYVYICVFPF
jgi:hypothetical protein